MITTFYYFYPRSPCGERHLRVVDGSKSSIISIHALLAESDRPLRQLQLALRHFYPRSPCGERLQQNQHQKKHKDISIHALLAESDRAASITPTASRNFYPRSPCGERQPAEIGPNLVNNFYPRSPCGERRRRSVKLFRQNFISIHALLAESDYDTSSLMRCQIKFLSTLSLRRATIDSSRAASCQQHFYPRSPCGERLSVLWTVRSRPLFLSTLSLRRATCFSAR